MRQHAPHLFAVSYDGLENPLDFCGGIDVQEREAAESAERGRGAAVIAAQLVERQEARLVAEFALKQVPTCCASCVRHGCIMCPSPPRFDGD
jgi:hypothetical protein